jgi:hypothetical protein
MWFHQLPATALPVTLGINPLQVVVFVFSPAQYSNPFWIYAHQKKGALRAPFCQRRCPRAPGRVNEGCPNPFLQLRFQMPGGLLLVARRAGDCALRKLYRQLSLFRFPLPVALEISAPPFLYAVCSKNRPSTIHSLLLLRGSQ